MKGVLVVNNTNTMCIKRIKELMEVRKVPIEEIAELCNYSKETMQKYLRENSDWNISVDRLYDIVTKYHVSADWLLGISNFMNENDSMINIISALDKVFRVKYKSANESKGFEPCPSLQIDFRFWHYLRDIQELQYQISNNAHITNEAYQSMRKHIFEEHKEYIKDIFSIDDFDEEKALEIKYAEDIKVIDLLSSALDIQDNDTQDTN